MVYVLIMAGGIGSRFWPKSRISKPKQFLPFFKDKTLIQTTVDRIRPIAPPERIIVSTNSDYVNLVKEQIPDIPEENIISEPVAKNTAPCIAFASALIHHRDPDATLVVLPSDHYIRDNDVFLNDLQACIKAVAQNKRQLVTIGIAPTRPDTGYGYIQYDDKKQISVNGHTAHPVKSFSEKPDLQTALKFLQSGDFLWNSGMFIWNVTVILQEIEKYLPVIHQQTMLFLDDLKANVGKIRPETLESVYHSCFPVSIDYGIMEKSDRVIVLSSRCDWSDLGSWMAVYEATSDRRDPNGNFIKSGNALIVHSENCYVESESNKMISLVGLQGIGIIETNDSLLICKLDKSQEVKEVHKLLKNSMYKSYQ